MEEFEIEIRKMFLAEAQQLLADVEECFFRLEREPDNAEIVEKIFRLAHSFKGSSGGVGYQDIMEFTHHFENVLVRLKKKEITVNADLVDFMLQAKDALAESVASKVANLTSVTDFTRLIAETVRFLQPGFSTLAQPGDIIFADDVVVPESYVATPAPAPAQASTPATALASKSNTTTPEKSAARAEEPMRVDPSRIDRIINSIGELVILQSVLEQNEDKVNSPLLIKTIAQLGKLQREIQSQAMDLRMVPLKPTFQRLQRIIRDTARALGKDVNVEVLGEDSEVDRTVQERITDPLVHMVRNAVDHGLEVTQERIDAGKSPNGTVTISAENRGDRLVIQIRDDGKGLDPERIWKKAVEKGLLSSDARYSAEAATQLIFLPGFSTKAQVTEHSGRGVGMDVVKTNIEALGGHIRVTSEIGKGSRFEITLPLSLGVVEGMVVVTRDERYIVPLAQVQETTRLTPEAVTTFESSQEMLTLRGNTMRLHRLPHLLGKKGSRREGPTEAIAIVLKRDDHTFHAIAVDDIVGQQAVVVKRLDAKLALQTAFAGGTILGDGKAALMLDLMELTNSLGA